MNKLIHISFALLVLLSTVGITVDKHYCGGHYVGTWFYAADDSCLSGRQACGMDMPADTDCCHDDITVYSVENEFQFVSTTTSPELQLIAYIAFPTKAQHNAIEKQFTNSIYWQSDFSPPISPPIYLKVQSFLI